MKKKPLAFSVQSSNPPSGKATNQYSEPTNRLTEFRWEELCCYRLLVSCFNYWRGQLKEKGHSFLRACVCVR